NEGMVDLVAARLFVFRDHGTEADVLLANEALGPPYAHGRGRRIGDEGSCQSSGCSKTNGPAEHRTPAKLAHAILLASPRAGNRRGVRFVVVFVRTSGVAYLRCKHRRLSFERARASEHAPPAILQQIASIAMQPCRKAPLLTWASRACRFEHAASGHHRASSRLRFVLRRGCAPLRCIAVPLVAATTAENDNQMQSSALFSNDHTSFARPGLDRK